MAPLKVIDRLTGHTFEEKVYGCRALDLLYGSRWPTRWIGRPLRVLVAHLPLCSSAYGWWQHQPWSATKIRPFIDSFGIDSTEFLDPIESFGSFNDFFIRKLKPEVRPIVGGDATAIIPADGRYFFFPTISEAQPFDVKDRRFDLATLLEDAGLVKQYAHASLVMARLCPTDYHRFHFPIACVPTKSRLVNGPLFSVNPIAIRNNLRILAENKRRLTTLQSPLFGKVLCIEVGATNVGSIHETYTPDQPVGKGDEKGYFSFGGSAMLLLFPPNTIRFDADLLAATRAGIEIRCLFGQSMGLAIAHLGQESQHLNV
jgi:phosphatidylserine decarboxylase